jgi:nucleoside-diphosphate-sugar epimerase
VTKKILITGGAGFIGLHLARRLLDEGCHVHLADNFARAVRDPALAEILACSGVSLSDIDCMDPEAVAGLPTNFDAIFHLAAIIGVVHVMERPYSVVVNNIVLLNNLIEHARRQKSLSRFLFASTSEVYAGTLEQFSLLIPTPESVPLALPDLARPRTSYMLSKITGEAVVHYSGLPYTIFRPHNVYGPRMGSIHVVPGQLKKAHDAKDGDVVPVPSCDQTRAFCYIDDAVEMLVRMMDLDECLGQVLNLGTESPEISIRDVARLCHATVGRDVSILAEPSPPGSPERRAPDMALTRKLTDYESRVSLEEGIAKTYAWYRHNVFDGHGVGAR